MSKRHQEMQQTQKLANSSNVIWFMCVRTYVQAANFTFYYQVSISHFVTLMRVHECTFSALMKLYNEWNVSNLQNSQMYVMYLSSLSWSNKIRKVYSYVHMCITKWNNTNLRFYFSKILIYLKKFII